MSTAILKHLSKEIAEVRDSMEKEWIALEKLNYVVIDVAQRVALIEEHLGLGAYAEKEEESE